MANGASYKSNHELDGNKEVVECTQSKSGDSYNFTIVHTVKVKQAYDKPIEVSPLILLNVGVFKLT